MTEETKTKRGAGRPRKYTPELAAAVCKQLSLGHSLRKVCKLPGMPSLSVVMEWLQQDRTFAEHYARAKRTGLELHIDQIIELADSATGENAHAVRLQVDTRKWLASKLMPKLYGDKVEVAADVTLDEKPMSNFELAKMILLGLRLALKEEDAKRTAELPLLHQTGAADSTVEPQLELERPPVQQGDLPPDPFNALEESYRLERRDAREAARAAQPFRHRPYWRKGRG